MSRCGTVAGYRDHYRAGESRCQPCKDAQTLAQQLRKAGGNVPRELLGEIVRMIPECGTRYGAARHRRRREPLDEACRRAENEWQRERYAARQAKEPKTPRPMIECALCEGLFTPTTSKARYCSSHCWELDNRTSKLVVALRMMTPEARRARIDQLAARRQRREIEEGRYGPEHQAERRRRLDERGPDERCARCRELLPEDESGIDLDHDDDDPTRYLGLSHTLCNRGKRPIVAELLAS